MARSLDAVLTDPWGLLELAVEGPLHPGGAEATAALLDRAGVDATTRLLDVGCGAGEALRLARERGARAVGLDRRPSVGGAVRGDLAALPFDDAAFDVALGECVLCLAPDLDRTLADLARIVAPGGRLALSDVTVEGSLPDLPARIETALCLQAGDDRSRGALRDRVAAAGFRVEDVRTHREDLLAMRDRLTAAVDLDRLASLLGDRGDRLRAGARDLEAAVEAGRIGYVSIVATRPA